MEGDSVDPAPQQVADETDARLSFGKKSPETVLDVKPSVEAGGDKGTDSLDARVHGMSLAASSPDDRFFYNMNYKNRGLFIIINNKQFQQHTGMNARTGTDEDAANLYQRFKELEFDIKVYKDLTTVQMLQVMTEAAKRDHSTSDCFGCAILSHGDDGIVYGTDGIIQVESLVAPFKGDICPGLLGKPKLFFIQACRGSRLDHGAEFAESDSDVEEKKVHRIPSEADFLYAYSTVPGYFSWRNSTKGSWFVQAFCKVLKEYAKTRDLVWIMTRVNHMVAYEFQSNASKEFMNKKKQIPSIVSMLTKDVIFKPKQ